MAKPLHTNAKSQFLVDARLQKRLNLRSLIRNHHGDGNGNVKKQHAFLDISLPSLHNYDVK